MEPLVPLDGIELPDSLLASVLGPERVEVGLPVVGGDGEAGESLDVVADVREEGVKAAERDLEVEEEVGALRGEPRSGRGSVSG